MVGVINEWKVRISIDIIDDHMYEYTIRYMLLIIVSK